MATGLVSSDPSLQVRKARNPHSCFGRNQSWRSCSCKGLICKGEYYVAQPFVTKGPFQGNKRHYCEHCALVALPSIKVGKVVAA